MNSSLFHLDENWGDDTPDIACVLWALQHKALSRAEVCLEQVLQPPVRKLL